MTWFRRIVDVNPCYLFSTLHASRLFTLGNSFLMSTDIRNYIGLLVVTFRNFHVFHGLPRHSESRKSITARLVLVKILGWAILINFTSTAISWPSRGAPGHPSVIHMQEFCDWIQFSIYIGTKQTSKAPREWISIWSDLTLRHNPCSKFVRWFDRSLQIVCRTDYSLAENDHKQVSALFDDLE